MFEVINIIILNFKTKKMLVTNFNNILKIVGKHILNVIT